MATCLRSGVRRGSRRATGRRTRAAEPARGMSADFGPLQQSAGIIRNVKAPPAPLAPRTIPLSRFGKRSERSWAPGRPALSSPTNNRDRSLASSTHMTSRLGEPTRRAICETIRRHQYRRPIGIGTPSRLRRPSPGSMPQRLVWRRSRRFRRRGSYSQRRNRPILRCVLQPLMPNKRRYAGHGIGRMPWKCQDTIRARALEHRNEGAKDFK
jgi:hypothetical protein